MEDFSDSSSLSDNQLVNALRTLLGSLEKGISRLDWPVAFPSWFTAIDDSSSEDEEPSSISHTDDGYCEQPHPLTLNDVEPEILYSQVAILPGCRDVKGRAVIVISCVALKQLKNISACQLTQLMLYYQTIPTADAIDSGFLILVDTSGYSDETWKVLDDAFCLLEAHQQGIIGTVLLLWHSESIDDKKLFSTSQTQCVCVHSTEQLWSWIPRNQLLCAYGGSYSYDHEKWIRFRKILEPFINDCRMSARHMVSHMEMPENQLDEDGDVIIRELRAFEDGSPHNNDYRECVERASSLYAELRQVESRFSKTQLHSTQVVRWLNRLNRESVEQQKTQLDEVSPSNCQDSEMDAYQLVRKMKKHEECETEPEQDDDTTACYRLMDKAYEWALETMRFVSGSSHADTPDSLSQQIDALQEYVDRMPEDAFAEMRRLAHNDKLRTHCQTVRERCLETANLLHSRQLTLQKVLQQMDGIQRNRAHSIPFSNAVFSGQERRRSTGGVASGSYTAFPSAYYPPIREHATTERVTNWAINRKMWLNREDSLEKAKAAVRAHLMSDTDCSESVSDDCDGKLVNSHSPCNVPSKEDSKSEKNVMMIMQELVQTERDYVKSLEYIIENYVCEVLRDDIPQALRGQRNVVFGNLEKIHEFHSHYFLAELEQAEPQTLGQCFLDFQPQFFLYALYSKNKPKSDALMAELGNDFFKAKQLELCDKMDLASYMLKPVQRMAKYALLLKQLLKECSHPALKEAEEMVRFQLRHGNDLLAMDALRDCDVNVKEQGLLLRQDEFIVWHGGGRKSVRRHVFLFQDLILFSKARNDHFHYKHSIKTCEMGLTEQVGDSDIRFEIWFRKRKAADTFLLQAATPALKAAWVRDLRDILTAQALHNKKNRIAELSSMGIGNKPCLDINPSEDQICDRNIPGLWTPRNSVISVSSSGSSGFSGTLNLGFQDSPRPLHRSPTHHSHCSTESGFCTDPGEGLAADGANDENITTPM